MKRVLNVISKISYSIGQDKYLHCLVSLILAFVVASMLPYYFYINYVISVLTVMLVGVAKELYDSGTGGTFDVKDIYADAVGMQIGLLLYLISVL